jgi:hypothetical protein
MHGKQKQAMDRRNFLRAVGGVSAAAVATAAVTLDSTEAEAYDPGEDETKSKYRETDHIKAYYRVNGYPTRKK